MAITVFLFFAAHSCDCSRFVSFDHPVGDLTVGCLYVRSDHHLVQDLHFRDSKYAVMTRSWVWCVVCGVWGSGFGATLNPKP